MRVILSAAHLRAIEAHGESSYPNEGAGFLLGNQQDGAVSVEALLPVENRREANEQFNRYELNPQDFMKGELEATRQGLSLVGVFHSHPDHPARPSEFDREHALPHFCYLITAIKRGRADVTHAWRLKDDRSVFDQDTLEIVETIH